MKKSLLVVTLLLITAPAHAEMSKGQLLYELPQVTGYAWSKNETSKVWELADSAFADQRAKCDDYLTQLDKLGVPSSTKVNVSSDTPDFKAGDHTLAELRTACDRTVKYGKIKYWEKWAIEAMRDNARLTSGQPLETAFMKNCISTYADMIKAGINPTEKVIEQTVNDNDGKPVLWSGTVEDLKKKWCEVGLKKVQAEVDKADAPYKKVLKGDKLKDALTYRSFWLVGGKASGDPAVLAKQNVWFTDSSPSEVCPNGAQVHVLTRLQYDKAQAISKVTTSRHCGNPPASAYK